MYINEPIRITEFSAQTLRARRVWNEDLSALKEKYFYASSVLQDYSSNLTEIKTFHNKEKPKKFMTSKTALQKLLKRILHAAKPALSKNPEERMHLTVKVVKLKESGLKNTVTGASKYLSGVSPKDSDLNSLIKRHRLEDWVRKEDPMTCCLQETHFITETRSESEGSSTSGSWVPPAGRSSCSSFWQR